MKAEFYLRDITEAFGRKEERRVIKNVLFFKLSRPALNGANVPAASFDNKATAEQVAMYPDAYRKFKEQNPSYSLPWAKTENVLLEELKAPKEIEATE
mgnify:FL=1